MCRKKQRRERESKEKKIVKNNNKRKIIVKQDKLWVFFFCCCLSGRGQLQREFVIVGVNCSIFLGLQSNFSPWQQQKNYINNTSSERETNNNRNFTRLRYGTFHFIQNFTKRNIRRKKLYTKSNRQSNSARVLSFACLLTRSRDVIHKTIINKTPEKLLSMSVRSERDVFVMIGIRFRCCSILLPTPLCVWVFVLPFVSVYYIFFGVLGMCTEWWC